MAKNTPAVAAFDTDNDYKLDDAVRTLGQAHKIMKDTKFHKAVKEHAKKKMHAMKAIAEGSIDPDGDGDNDAGE